MQCHLKLEEYLDAYITAAGIANDRKGSLFRSAIGKTGKLTDKPVRRGVVRSMVRRHASGAGIETAAGGYKFRAIGNADYPVNGGRIEVVQRMV